jgi:hypothetical protein
MLPSKKSPSANLPVRHGLGLAAEPEGLTHEVALRAQLRRGRAGLLRLAVGKAGHAERAAQTEALVELRIVIQLGVVGQLEPEEGGGGERAARLMRHEAVVAAVRRMEARHPLVDERRLAVQREAAGVAVVRIVGGELVGFGGQAQSSGNPEEPRHHLV